MTLELRQLHLTTTMPCTSYQSSLSHLGRRFHSTFTDRCQSLSSNWSSSPRWNALKRPYTPKDVISKQGSIPPLPPPSLDPSRKLFQLLQEREKQGEPVHTLGAVDPVQVTQMARAGLEAVYVSGWACSSMLTTGNNELGPDLA